MTGSLHISLVAETIFSLFGFPITNSLLTTWLVMIVFLGFVFFATQSIRLIPSRLQSLLEVVVEGLYSLFETILHEKTRRFFPLLMTFFLFIILQNWSGLLPGVGTIGLNKTEVAHDTALPAGSDEHLPDPYLPVDPHLPAAMPVEPVEESHSSFVPLFRAGTADLNTTLALALIAVAMVQYVGFTTLKGAYARRFINFSSPISFFIGILEIVQEFSRILSFAFRLFGNVFAGEVLLVVMAFLMPLLLPVPFLGMELFVGFIQALVFTMLTTVFLSLATSDDGH